MRSRTGNKEKSIADAAVSVFARDGFHGARIASIAKEAGVATGSVYLYFRNKESILHHLFHQIWQRIRDQLVLVVNKSDKTPKEKVEDIVDRLFALFSRDPALAQVFVNEHYLLLREGTGAFVKYYEDFLLMGEEVVRDGIRQGQFRADIDPRIYSNFVFGGIRQLLQFWARAPREYSFNSIRQRIKTIALNGLLPQSDSHTEHVAHEQRIPATD